MMRISNSPLEAIGDWHFKGDAIAAIPDHTRAIDTNQALLALSQKGDGKITTIIGLGLHRKMTDLELKPLKSWDPIQHDPDDCRPTITINGIPGLINKLVTKSKCVVSIGVVEPHQYAGFSGGHKGVAIGLGGRTTILALHEKKSILQKGVNIGQLIGNPFRRTIDVLGQAAGCEQALLFIPKINKWLFGDPIEALQKASQLASPFYKVNKRYQKVRLIVPKSKQNSLYQASRAATYLALSPNPPLTKGAKIILQAPLREGLGSESGFRDALYRYRPPWSDLLKGGQVNGPGAQRAIMLALAAQHYEIQIIGCENPKVFKRIGIAARCDIPKANGDTLILKSPFLNIPQV